MSTNINITVGDNALLDAARQQQVANRQGQLQKEASLRLEAQATAARTTALAAQGRDANGNPIFGAHLSQPQIERRPTANRQQDYYVAELRNVFVGKTRSGDVSINIVIEDGSEFKFNLASTFSYPNTDQSSAGIGNIVLGDSADFYEPPGDPAVYDIYEDPLILDVGAAPPVGLNWTRTIITEAAATADYFSNLILLLPVKTDACIVVSLGKGIRERVTAKRIETNTHAYVEYTRVAPPAPNTQRWRHDYYRDYSSETAVTGSDSYQWIKCFYTTKNTCREINAPQQLYELLEDYLDSISISVVWIYDTFSYLKGRIDGEEITGAYENKLDVGSWSRTLEFAPYFTDKLKLYTLFASNSTATTPGVYKAIQLDSDDSRFSNPSDDNLTDVSYMVNQFYDGSYANLAKFGIQTTFAFLPEYAPKYYRHDRTRNRPTYNGPLSGPDLNQLIINPKVRTRNTNWLAWDWNNPGYCRQQLLALGFTSADLAP